MPGFVPNWAANLGALNVKDFGAKGDGSTDDTAAVQACMDAAWGPVSNPHGAELAGGLTGPHLNRPIYIPPGDYNLTSITPLSIVAITDDGTGRQKVQVANTAGLQAGWIINISGVTSTTYGSLATGFMNIPHGIASIVDSTHFIMELNQMGVEVAGVPWANWNSVFDAGTGTIQTSALHARAVESGVMCGGGLIATRLRCSDGNAVMSVNGFGNCVMRDMSLDAVTGAYCVFDFNWTDKTTDLAQTRSSQNCLFENMGWGGISGVGPLILVGVGGRQTDTSTWLNNNFGGNAGGVPMAMQLGNQNAIGHNVIGGNIQAFGTVALDSGGGAFTLISGVTFTNNAQSIRLHNSNPNSTAVVGCSSEDLYFIECHGGIGLSIISCEHRGIGSPCHFLFYEGGDPSVTNGICTVTSSWSTQGDIAQFSNGKIFITGNTFGIGPTAAFANVNGASNGRVIEYNIGATTFSRLPAPTQGIAGLRMMLSDATAVLGTAPATLGAAVAAASFTATISGTTMTVSSGTGIVVGQGVTGPGVAPNTVISAGSSTSWTISPSQTVSTSTPMISGGGGTAIAPIYCDWNGTTATWRYG